MPRSEQDEAIILRVYDVGEADRFCILLTKTSGRMTARAQGARRMSTRRCRGLLPLHRVRIGLEEHSFGHTITSVECIDAHDGAWSDPILFAAAASGIELLLRLTDDSQPLRDLYDLTAEFLAVLAGISSDDRTPHSSLLRTAFTVRLLSILGLLPSVTHSCISGAPLTGPVVMHGESSGLCARSEYPRGRSISDDVLSLLQFIQLHPLHDTLHEDAHLLPELEALVTSFLGSQLGSPLAVPAVRLRISSDVTPICHVSGRAS